MEYIELKDSNNNVYERWPCEWFELNERQQIACIGGDFTAYGGIYNVLDEHPEINALPIGRVSDQGFVFMKQIVDGLELNGWDFESWPDPEVVLLIKKDNSLNKGS